MADKYWIGGDGSWSDSAHWAASSGGEGGQDPPDSTNKDNAHFDNNSGSAVITLGGGRSCGDFDSTGSSVSFANDSNSLSVYGSFTLSAQTVFGSLSDIYLRATSTGKTITTNGVTVGGALSFLGTGGGWTLQDDLTVTDNIDFRAGTIDANDQDVTCAYVNRSSSAGAAVLNMGSGTWTVSSGGVSGFWSLGSTPANITLNCETSTIKYSPTGTTARTFTGGGLIYYNLWISGTGTGAVTIAGSNTFNNIRSDCPKTIKFTNGTSQTVTSLTVDGTADSKNTMQGATDVAYLRKNSGQQLVQNCNITNLSVSGGAAWIAGEGCTVTGTSAGWSGWTPRTAVSTSWTARTKPTTSWTERTKPSTSWTTRTKPTI